MTHRIPIGALALAAAALAWPARTAAQDALPTHRTPPSADGSLVVGLCDGQTALEVKGHRAGESLARPEAQQVSDRLMEAWARKNPEVAQSWRQEALVAQAQPTPPAPGGSGPKASPTQQPAGAPGTSKESASSGATGIAQQRPELQVGHTYGAFSARDEALWKASTQAVVETGSQLFHDAQKVGGTVGISCDMCHPNAANTHPETYPKYQVQLGRTALLRDMINWCIENPVRGKPLHDDDPRLKALEAFILAQRKGVPLEYGKH